MNRTTQIAIMVVLCLTFGYLSSLIAQNSLNAWYAELEKPFFTPPNWLFASGWIVSFVVMGIASGIIWNKKSLEVESVKKALLFFFVQLLFAVLWFYLLFGLHNLLLASIEIFLLFLLIYETYFLFKLLNKTAGKLLLPYLFWVGFISVFTISIYFLNFIK